MHKATRNAWRELGNGVNALMHIESTVDVVKYLANLSFARYKDGFTVMRIAVNSFDEFGANKERVLAVFNLVFVIATTSLYVRQLAERFYPPIFGKYTCVGLLVTRPQFHANPIFARCLATLVSSVATFVASCGNGVS